MAQRVILVYGYPGFRDALVRAVNAAEGNRWAAETLSVRGRGFEVLRRILRSNVIIMIGGPWLGGRFIAVLGVLARLRSKPAVIVYWAGSDVMEAARSGSWARGPVGRWLLGAMVHFVTAPWLQGELAGAGIRAQQLYLPAWAVSIPERVPPFPAQVRVLAYLPGADPRFYGAEFIRRLSMEFPSVEFVIVGQDAPTGGWPGNVQVLGWVSDMSQLYPRVTALIRLPRHDSMARMVVEALSYGRYVAWTHAFPGVCRCESLPQVRSFLADLVAKADRGALAPNEEGRQAARDIGPEPSLARLLDAIDKELSRRSRGRRGAVRT